MFLDFGVTVNVHQLSRKEYCSRLVMVSQICWQCWYVNQLDEPGLDQDMQKCDPDQVGLLFFTTLQTVCIILF